MAGERTNSKHTQLNFEEMLTNHKQFMSESLQTFKDSVNSRVDNCFAKFNDEIEQVTRNIEFAHAEIMSLKLQAEKLPRLSIDIERIENQMNNLELSLDYLDNQSRRKNIRIKGIPEYF